MFDKDTETLLRSAPAIKGLNIEELPQTLTRCYAELSESRLYLSDSSSIENKDQVLDKLARIADTYEGIASLIENQQLRRSSAFVAATAHQIMSRTRKREAHQSPSLSRDRVAPTISASLLFLVAEQYADAYEAAASIINSPTYDHNIYMLIESIRDFAQGKIYNIIKRSETRERSDPIGNFEDQSTALLYETLLTGLEILSATLLSEPVPQTASNCFDDAKLAFRKVLDLSTSVIKVSQSISNESFLITYPGPKYLATLLLSTAQEVANSSIIQIKAPPGADEYIWKKWLKDRAKKTPFLWQNHRDALDKGFHEMGKSSVIVLPTGSGKTTLSTIKIAGVLASRNKVIFLAPTHALIDELRNDLREMFPKNVMDIDISATFDLILPEESTFESIEVMTPERCLALLAFSPEAFSNIGLLVYDECHLLSCNAGSLRRALDGMLCVLAFNKVAPNADFLFLSAMLKNGNEFSEWIGELTNRNCIYVDSQWKPSRQARGVLMYDSFEMSNVKSKALSIQMNTKKTKKNLIKAAKEELKLHPYALFGLKHNWNEQSLSDRAIIKLSNTTVNLSGTLVLNKVIRLQPNANKIAANIAAFAIRSGLKAILFVNVAKYTISIVKDIQKSIESHIPFIVPTPEENVLWSALDVELGGRQHSLLAGSLAAMPHSADLLRVERKISESMFRRPGGSSVIVATTTLSQGLNLPAEIAILAGDKRMDETGVGRESLKSHEILNAAARAGRAGHLANGLVLLIPEIVLEFKPNKQLSKNAIRNLRAILPNDDRCVDLADPLGLVLDRIQSYHEHDLDIPYLFNRFQISSNQNPETIPLEIFSRSFAAFQAKRRNDSKKFEEQINNFKQIITSRINFEIEDDLLLIANQAAIPSEVLQNLKDYLHESIDNLPNSIKNWIFWMFNWLKMNKNARESIFGRIENKIKKTVGKNSSENLGILDLDRLMAGLISWINGLPLREIETSLGGNPDTRLSCPRARELVTSIIPHTLSFVFGIIAQIAKCEIEKRNSIKTLPAEVECLATAIREGFDLPEKIVYSKFKMNLTRVQSHNEFYTEFGLQYQPKKGMDFASIKSYVRDKLDKNSGVN